VPTRAEKLRRANRAMRREVQAFNVRVDAEVREQLTNLDGGVSCTKGCAGCCRQLTVTTSAEAQNIVESYPNLVRQHLPAFEAQDKALEAIAAAQGLPPELTNETRTALSNEWWLQGHSCAFLANGLCTIYAQRPIACRTYFVRSDPALCHDPEVGRAVDVVQPRALLTGFAHLLQVGARHGDASVAALPTAILHAWKRH